MPTVVWKQQQGQWWEQLVPSIQTKQMSKNQDLSQQEKGTFCTSTRAKPSPAHQAAQGQQWLTMVNTTLCSVFDCSHSSICSTFRGDICKASFLIGPIMGKHVSTLIKSSGCKSGTGLGSQCVEWWTPVLSHLGKAGPNASGVPLNLWLHHTKIPKYSLKKINVKQEKQTRLSKVIAVFVKELQSKGHHMMSYSSETNPRHLNVIFIAQHT